MASESAESDGKAVLRLPSSNSHKLTLDHDKLQAIPTDSPWITTSSRQSPQTRPGPQQAPINSHRLALDLDKFQATPTRSLWNWTSSKQFPQARLRSRQGLGNSHGPACISTSSKRFPQARHGSRQAPSNSNRLPLELDKLRALPTRRVGGFREHRFNQMAS